MSVAPRFHAPERLDEALAIAHEAEGATVVGGGTIVVPDMRRGSIDPGAIVDLSRLGLSGVREADDGLEIGAMTTYRDCVGIAARHPPLQLLGLVAARITGGPQIVNQGTIGGSACHANPSSDVPAALVALGARMRLQSTGGTRDVAAEAFFTGAFETVRRTDELLTSIAVAGTPGVARTGFDKLKTCESSWPIVSASCVIRRDADAYRLRLAIGAASPVPVLLEEGVARLSDIDAAGTARRAAALIVEEWQDALAGPGYRRAVAHTVARRAVEGALEGGSR